MSLRALPWAHLFRPCGAHTPTTSVRLHSFRRRFGRGLRLGCHAEVVDAELPRSAIESHAADRFAGPGWHIEGFRDFPPAKRALPGTDHLDRLHRIPFGIEVLEHEAGLVISLARANFFGANRKADLNRRHLP